MDRAQEEQFLCGLGSWHPQWLQKLAHPCVYMIFFSALGILQGAYYSYFIGISNTLEKRFAFSSSTGSVVNMADNLGPIMFSALIGYLSAKGHRPRWAAGAMVVASISSLLGALPYFLFGPDNDYFDEATNSAVEPTTDDIDFCQETDVDLMVGCDNEKQENIPSIVLLFSSNFLNGIVASVYYSAGTSYLDDSVSKVHAPMYMTVTAFMRGIGPIIGFLLSSFCLWKYEDPAHPPSYDSEDPRWIGAWWLGFAILSFFMTLFSIPLIFFPKSMNRSNSASAIAESPEMTCLGTAEEGPQQLSGLVFPKDLSLEKVTSWMEMGSEIFGNGIRLAKNPIYVLHLFSQVFKWFGVIGYFNYMHKYLQEQFRVSASEASLFGGAVPLCVALVTTSIGGVFVRYVKPKPKTLTLLMFVCEVITVILFASLMLYRCEPPSYPENLVAECNADCHCSTEIFHPVCIGSTTYFSPCFAGCRANSLLQNTSDPTIDRYENCECAKLEMKNSTVQQPNEAVEGRCHEETPECTRQFQMYVATLTCMYCLAFLLQVAHILLPMRCVEKEDKTFALAVFEGVCCLFAFIPYPFAYSFVIDKSCQVWEMSCNQRGNCWIYDLSALNRRLHGLPVATCLLNCVCMYGIYLLADRGSLARFYEDDEEERQPEDATEPLNGVHPAVLDRAAYSNDTETMGFSATTGQ